MGAFDSQGGDNGPVPDVTYRCDSAPYTSPGNACIFHRIAGRLSFDRKDRAVAGVANHIYDAEIHPERTYPKWKGKTVPARLHRIYWDTKRRKRNHDTAIRTCKKYWPHYNTKTLDCDEFPFQSTKEGAAKGDKRYSARPVNQGQNQLAGSRQGAWYTSDHIIDGDAFYVVIK